MSCITRVLHEYIIYSMYQFPFIDITIMKQKANLYSIPKKHKEKCLIHIICGSSWFFPPMILLRLSV